MARTQRPPNPHTQRLSLYLKPEWAEALDQLAGQDGRSLNDVTREALRDYFRKRGVKVS